MSEPLDTIQRTVEATVEGPVTHRESVAVVETFRGQIVWEGMVEVFDVAQPPPVVAYGWAVESDQGPQYVTVKGVPPADSPLAAVRVWLVSQAKK
ncbi:MAG: hypothetical protein P4L99_18375 [Chthoniobacter sp.]|nr:hypothetical protein [Chthoniobacter sp.]